MATERPNKAILSAAERHAQVAEDLGRTYAHELARVKQDLEREIRRAILRAREGSRTATALAARGLSLRRELREMLTAAGYDDLAEASTVRGLDRMATAIERLRVAAQVSRFTSRDATRIAALKQLARLDLLAQGDEVAIGVWRSVVQGLYSQRPSNAILDDLAEALDRELREVATLYDTAVSTFGRQVELLKSTGDADELFVYVGPVDAKTRPFCLEHVGNVYTRAEIDELDNGQLGSTFLTAGGFSCRHHWAAISKFSELTDLHGTDGRVPEIQAQVDRVNSQKREKRQRNRRSGRAS